MGINNVISGCGELTSHIRQSDLHKFVAVGYRFQPPSGCELDLLHLQELEFV